MAVFKFRLASVLRYRQRLQEEKEWELGLLLDTRRQNEEKIASLEHQQLANGADIDGDREKIVSVTELHLRASYNESLAQRARELRVEVKRLDQAIAEKREALVEALRQVKMLERLRDRRAESFNREQTVQEQKLTDEMSQRKFVRRSNG